MAQMHPPRKKTPPTPDQLHAALDRLNLPASEWSTAAMHLATPAKTVLGRHVTLDDDTWRWNRTIIRQTKDVVADAVGLVQAAAPEHNDELWLDLEADPVTWCKPLLHGPRKVLFGTELLELPLVGAEPDMTDSAMFAAAVGLRDGWLSPPELLVTGDGTHYLIDGGDGWAFVRRA